MKRFSALLALCEGNPPATGRFPPQRPVKWSFNVFFDLRLNKPLSKQSGGGDLRHHRACYDVIVMLHDGYSYYFLFNAAPLSLDVTARIKICKHSGY